MKFSIYPVLLLLFCSSLSAQDCDQLRYKNRVFDEIKVTRDLVYGQVDPYEPILEVNTLEDVELDFYEPVGDPLAIRPLVVAVYGGAFLFGTKEDADVQAWCDSLTHRGYACAAINYRLGLNVTNERSAFRAVYRAVQDLRAAIRYLEEDPDNLGFRVDPDNIFVEGQSAGAITAIHTAFISDEERPTATFENNLSLDDGSDLGCLDCSGNNYDQPVKIKGILSMWGALQNLSFADSQEELSILMVHGDGDPVVPYGTGRPFNSPFFPTVHGSNVMKDRYAELGFYQEFYPFIGNMQHTVYGEPIAGTFPTENWEPIFENSQKFLHKIIQFDSPIPSGTTLISDGMTATYFVPVSTNNYCWTVTGGTIMQDNGNEITVEWGDVTNGTVQVREENYFALKGEPGILNVSTNADALPLTITDFRTKIIDDEVHLFWSVTDATEEAQFFIEKSADGQDFITLTTKQAGTSTSPNSHYKVIDAQPFKGSNFYRLQILATTGEVTYSPIIQANLTALGVEIYIQNQQNLVVELKHLVENGKLQLFDLQGNQLLQTAISESAAITLPILGTGIYVVRLQTENGVVQRKVFVP